MRFSRRLRYAALWLSIEASIRLSGLAAKLAAWWPVTIRIEWRDSRRRSRPSPRLIDGGPEPGWRRIGEVGSAGFHSRAWDSTDDQPRR